MHRTLMALALATATTAAHALTTAEKDLAFSSFNNAFYVSNNGNAYYGLNQNRNAPGRLDFWRVCETIEAAEDSYDRAPTTGKRDQIRALLNGLNNVVSGTTDFASWNEYNDDVMWAVIALARGYEITGNRPFLDQAMWQFNSVWSRAWDTTLGGGLWWRGDKQTKNACVNGPGVIAALILARNTTNTGYRAQALQIYNWMRGTLVNTGTGAVDDNINRAGQKVGWRFTYNQGTWAGAGILMFQSYGTTGYRSDASLAVNWTKNNLTGQRVAGILNDEYNAGDGGNDSAGFKGPFVRWAAKYANVANDAVIKSWLTQNANAAWQYRNSSGITWGQWWHRTNDTGVTSWECSSSLAVTQCAP